MRPFQIDQLPLHSPWPARLLREDSRRFPKTPEEVQREYGVEKWGGLLERWRTEGPRTLAGIDAWFHEGIAEMPMLVEGELVLGTPAEAKETYLGILEGILAGLDSRALVELGSGYGTILLDLLRRGRIPIGTAAGGEYTSSGVELATEIAAHEGLPATFGRCDFLSDPMTDFAIAPGSGILTSFSMAYVPTARAALESMLATSPAWVLHVEPILEHFDPGSLLGLLQARYLRTNDYSGSLLGDLRRLESEGRLRILQERPGLFGSNCLLPCSAILWEPVG